MIHDSELGQITFRRSSRAKRMNIRVTATGLSVALPIGFSEREGMEFVNSVRQKIRAKQRQMEAPPEAEKPQPITENNPLQTLTFRVQVVKTERENIYSALQSGVLRIEFPAALHADEPQTQRYFWNSIRYFLRVEAKRTLPHRTRLLAEQHQFHHTGVKIQSSRTRWGSCNSRKVINLSLYLLLLPPHLIDYVILHELCHTREMNHSPRFWAWMDKVTDGKSAALRGELKQLEKRLPLPPSG